MASDLPLNLYRTEYKDLDWSPGSSTSRELTIKTLQRLWTEHTMKAAIIRGKLWELEAGAERKVMAQAEGLLVRRKEKKYTKLMDLPRCPSLEDKIKTIAKKRKIELPAAAVDNMEEDGDE